MRQTHIFRNNLIGTLLTHRIFTIWTESIFKFSIIFFNQKHQGTISYTGLILFLTLKYWLFEDLVKPFLVLSWINTVKRNLSVVYWFYFKSKDDRGRWVGNHTALWHQNGESACPGKKRFSVCIDENVFAVVYLTCLHVE